MEDTGIRPVGAAHGASRAPRRRSRSPPRPPRRRPTRPRPRSSTSTTRSCAARASSSSPGGCRGATSSAPATSPRWPGSRSGSSRSARTSSTWPRSASRRWPWWPATRSPSSTRIGEEIYDEAMADKIWPGTRALAQGHLDAGQQVWLVTATPVELAQVIARRLGLTGALGTVAESVDGVYTGRLVGEPLHGPAKADGGPRAGRSERAWTCRGAPRTRTRPTTSRCCRWSATPARSTPTRRCARTPGPAAGRSWTTAGTPGREAGPAGRCGAALAGALAASARRRRS